jgi:hypothetical protein
MPDNPAVVDLVLKHPTWGPEYIQRLAATTKAEGRLSPERSQEIAAAVAMEHGPELLAIADKQRGIPTVDTAALPPDYVAKLQHAKVRDADVLEAAEYSTGLRGADALRVWTERAARAATKPADVEKLERQFGGYVPGVSTPAEGEV